MYPNRLEPHRCQLSEEPTARVLRDALRAADCGSRTHTAKRPTPGCGRVPPAPARLPAPSNGLVALPPCGSLAHLTAVRLKRLGGKAAHQQEPPSPLADSDPKLGLADSEPRVGHDSDRLTRILPGNSELRPDRDSDSLTWHPEG